MILGGTAIAAATGWFFTGVTFLTLAVGLVTIAALVGFLTTTEAAEADAYDYCLTTGAVFVAGAGAVFVAGAGAVFVAGAGAVFVKEVGYGAVITEAFAYVVFC